MSSDCGENQTRGDNRKCAKDLEKPLWRLDWNLGLTIEHWANVQPKKVAFVDSVGSVTYEELAYDIAVLRSAMQGAGVSKGDCVAAILPSGAAFASILFAAMQMGANLAPLDVLLTGGEVGKRLKMMTPKLVFAASQEHVRTALDFGCRTISVEDDATEGEPYRDFLASAENCEVALLCTEAEAETLPALTIFTSGTTGQPKGVLLSERNLEHAVSSIEMALNASADDVFLTSLPFSHIYGINTGVLLPMVVGATSVLLPKFKSGDSLDLIERHGVSVYNGVPSVYKRMMAVQAQQPRNLSSMRTGTIAGAKCTNLEDIHAVLHCAVRILYGSTESPILVMTGEDDSLDEKVTGVGRVNPTVELRIVGEAGCLLADGQEGEITCLSPGTMLGYYQNEEATRECVDEAGWIHTGDVGYVDEDGYLHVVGRKNDVINRGGYKVYPAEVEGVYNDNPAVFDCSVMGLPHAELGQQIVLFASLVDEGMTPGQLRCYAKGKLAKYKIPDQVILLDKIPYLASGKQDKRAMVAIYEAGAGVFSSDEERHKAQEHSASS